MATSIECEIMVMGRLGCDRGEEFLFGWRKFSSTRLSENWSKAPFASQTTNDSKDLWTDNFLFGELAKIGECCLKTFFRTNVVIFPALVVTIGLELFAGHENFSELVHPPWGGI